MTLDPSDPHDLRPTEEAAIETAHLAMDGLTEEDSVPKVVAILKKVDGVTGGPRQTGQRHRSR